MIIDSPVFASLSVLPPTGIEGQTCVVAGVGTYNYINGDWEKVLDAGAPAASADKLATPRKINGVDFDGTADITIAATGSGEPAITAGTTSDYWRGDKTFQPLNKAAVGLSAVNNTADADKPVSTAQQTALESKESVITPGTTAQYFRGDKTFVDFATSVNAAALTGLSLTSLTPVAATDTHLAAVGKLQAQHTNLVKVAAVASTVVDCSLGSYFTKTITAVTNFTVSNVPASGTCASIMLELTNGGSQTVTWFTGVTWAGGAAPTLTAAGVDVLGFYTLNGGTTWRGFLMAKDIK